MAGRAETHSHSHGFVRLLQVCHRIWNLVLLVSKLSSRRYRNRKHTAAQTFLVFVNEMDALNVTLTTAMADSGLQRAPRKKQSEFVLQGTSSSPCLSSASCNFMQFLCHSHVNPCRSFAPPLSLSASLALSPSEMQHTYKHMRCWRECSKCFHSLLLGSAQRLKQKRQFHAFGLNLIFLGKRINCF